MTTLEAFGQMINTRGIYKTLEMNESTVRNFRIRFKKNPDLIKLSTMEEMLEKAGWVVVQEKLWKSENKKS